MKTFNLANFPYSLSAALLYAFAASFSVLKWPSIFVPIYALQGLIKQTPLYLELLFLLFLLLIVFSEIVQILKLHLRLSNPFPFIWSVSGGTAWVAQ